MGVYEIHNDRFRAKVVGNAMLETLGEGYRWLEGPVWFADRDCLYVSDLPSDRILCWSEGGGVTIFRTPAGFPNGKARDCQGRMIGCSHQDRCIWRIELDGAMTVLASHYEGKRLNSPNDLVCKSDGSIWFTDPPYGIEKDYEGGRQRQELPANVYRLSPDSGELTVVAGDFEGPNGLAFSPDENRLYISESGREFDAEPTRALRQFTVGDDGVLTGGDAFYQVSPGYTDGLKVDEDGDLWLGAGDGVHCVGPDGKLLGKILTPAPVSNLCFGGRAYSRLFLCVSHTLMAVYTNVRGCVRP